MSIQDQLRTFILEEFRWDRPPGDLTDDFPLLEAEIIDSMGIFRLVGFLESEIGVEVLDEELVAGNFASIGDIARLVESKQ